MGLLSAAGRALARGGRGAVRRAGEAADAMDALANYALITGSLGGLGGMLMSAGDVQSRGGTQEDINEAAMYGGRAGAIGGPLAFGPALAGTAMLGPVGASPLVPWALITGSEGSRRFDERRRKREKDEAAMRAIELQLMRAHRR